MNKYVISTGVGAERVTIHVINIDNILIQENKVSVPNKVIIEKFFEYFDHFEKMNFEIKIRLNL